MGFKNDVEKVIVDNMSDADGETIELSSFQKKKVKQMAKGLTDAIITFLKAQEFKITEMEATVDIEEIRTVTPLTGVPNAGGPIVIGGAPASPTPFYLAKRGGAGGFMVSSGKAYIGQASANNAYKHNTNNSQLTKVKLLEVKRGSG